MELAEAKNKLIIDKNNLDEVLLFQADLFYDVSKEFALATSVRDEKKMMLDQKYADISLKYREDWDGDKKPTDKMIEQLTEADPDYTNAYKEYLKAKNDADSWLVMKEAYQQRSSMIKTLGDLYIAGYWTVKKIECTDPDISYRANRKRVNGKGGSE